MNQREHVLSLWQDLMVKKEVVGDVLNQLRLTRQRAAFEGLPPGVSEADLNSTLAQLLLVLERLDEVIGAHCRACALHASVRFGQWAWRDDGAVHCAGPMLEQDGHHFNQKWGYLSRAGLNDKSQFTRQIEKHADVYTSRVSNLLRLTNVHLHLPCERCCCQNRLF